ncbi:MAG: hypothetical protein ABR550_05500 [Wenzhouxiangellaceae bacterium]
MNKIIQTARFNLGILLLSLLTAASANADDLTSLGAVVAEKEGVLQISIQVGNAFLNGQEKVGENWSSETISLVPVDSDSGLTVGSNGTGLTVGSNDTGAPMTFDVAHFGDLAVNNAAALEDLANGEDTSGNAYYLDVHSSGTGVHVSLVVWANQTLSIDVASGDLSVLEVQ